jgi:hypothetical protein
MPHHGLEPPSHRQPKTGKPYHRSHRSHSVLHEARKDYKHLIPGLPVRVECPCVRYLQGWWVQELEGIVRETNLIVPRCQGKKPWFTVSRFRGSWAGVDIAEERYYKYLYCTVPWRRLNFVKMRVRKESVIE